MPPSKPGGTYLTIRPAFTFCGERKECYSNLLHFRVTRLVLIPLRRRYSVSQIEKQPLKFSPSEPIHVVPTMRCRF